MEPGSSFFNRSAESFIGDTFDAELLDAVVDHWHQEMMTSKDRDATLHFLGVSPTVAQSLLLGVSNRTLVYVFLVGDGVGSLDPYSPRGARHSSLDRPRGFSWVRSVPIFHEGVVTGLFARRLDRSREEFWLMVLYLRYSKW